MEMTTKSSRQMSLKALLVLLSISLYKATKHLLRFDGLVL